MITVPSHAYTPTGLSELISTRDDSVSIEAWGEALRGLDDPTLLTGTHAVDEDGATSRSTTTALGERETELLRGFVRSRGLTTASLIQVAWGIVLAELLGRDDVVFGGTVSGRPPQVSGVESMVGLFINTVPVRVRLDPRESLAALCIRVQAEQARLSITITWGFRTSLRQWAPLHRSTP